MRTDLLFFLLSVMLFALVGCDFPLRATLSKESSAYLVQNTKDVDIKVVDAGIATLLSIFHVDLIIENHGAHPIIVDYENDFYLQILSSEYKPEESKNKILNCVVYEGTYEVGREPPKRLKSIVLQPNSKVRSRLIFADRKKIIILQLAMKFYSL